MKVSNESQMQRIIRRTGRKPTQCKCALCQQQCHTTPCLGTPQDILKLVKAGYAERLALTDWYAGMTLGIVDHPIPMLQAKVENGRCTFFHDGLCELHDKGLKPTEGKLSHHTTKIDNFTPRKSISWNVAKEWEDSDNLAVVEEIVQVVKSQTQPQE